MANENWQFTLYCSDPEAFSSNSCLWRHDLDASLDCAVRVAQIEKEERVVSTYFIHLHNTFYNPISARSLELIKEIKDCGHEIGLHFDISYYQNQGKLTKQSELERYLHRERDLFIEWFDSPCRVISFHNPDVGIGIDLSEISYGGMINASSDFYRKNFNYVSDSNGYWRFQRLQDVLLAGAKAPIHILTHPEWWSESILATEERLDLSIQKGIDAAKAEQKAFNSNRGRLMP